MDFPTIHFLTTLIFLILISHAHPTACATPSKTSTNFIKKSCNTTTYPSLCVKTLTPTPPPSGPTPETLHRRARGGHTSNEQLHNHRLETGEPEGDHAPRGACDQGLHRRHERRGVRAEADAGRHGPPGRRRQGIPVGEREDVRQRRHHRRGDVRGRVFGAKSESDCEEEDKELCFWSGETHEQCSVTY
ncbi:hypothetical protein DH2020_048506 [Rehmannia glutinosa]|uniref:Uncharacterized protein n=1 Tax=Rehmannia glutinosa TaxID=99300 RepID=A0ABR0U5I4_REHGL